MVIKFTQLGETSRTYSYHAQAEEIGGETHQSECDVDKMICQFSGLSPASSYDISVRACFTPIPGDTICSISSKSTSAWTHPKGMQISGRNGFKQCVRLPVLICWLTCTFPNNFVLTALSTPNVEKTSDTSVVMGFTKLTDTLHSYTYRGGANQTGSVVIQINCDGDKSICIFNGLEAASTYELSVRVCFVTSLGEELCSLWSPTVTAWTNPAGLQLTINVNGWILL